MSKQTIYDALRANGLSRWGALAMMGNWQQESGNEAVRLEGDFDTSRAMSKDLMKKVDSGAMPRATFIYMGRGWGLAQWTFWSRLAGLYDLCKAAGKSIGDEAMQVKWAIQELKNGYPDLLKLLKSAKKDQLYLATSRVCTEYERPYINNIDARYNDALTIANEVKDGAQPEPQPEPPKTKYWPPRMVDKNMTGTDVEVLQAILKARGYNLHYISGTFDDLTERETKNFQRDSQLVSDGVCGPMTWTALLKK